MKHLSVIWLSWVLGVWVRNLYSYHTWEFCRYSLNRNRLCDYSLTAELEITLKVIITWCRCCTLRWCTRSCWSRSPLGPSGSWQRPATGCRSPSGMRKSGTECWCHRQGILIKNAVFILVLVYAGNVTFLRKAFKLFFLSAFCRLFAGYVKLGLFNESFPILQSNVFQGKCLR